MGQGQRKLASCASRTPSAGGSQPSAGELPRLPQGVLPSAYQQRVARLAEEVLDSPPDCALEETLRQCIAFSYQVPPERAQHVAVATVFADNPSENQFNAPVYSTLLVAWGEPGFEAMELHEACYNCIGRHKEVFEYCIYDLLRAEEAHHEVPARSSAPEAGEARRPLDVDGARSIVRRYAELCLDKHKRAALHAAALSPLKFLHQDDYEVFENLDSHGASFWSTVMSEAFFRGLEMPFESIAELDKGWSWGAKHFLPAMASGPEQEALRRLSAPESLGRDWRQVTAGLRPRARPLRQLPGLPWSFGMAVRAAATPGSALHKALVPYAGRFAEFMATDLCLRHFVRRACASERWDLDIGPALAALAPEALGDPAPPSPADLRHRLCFAGSASPDALAAEDAREDVEAASALLGAAGVAWAQLGR